MWPAIIGSVLTGLVQQDANRRQQNTADEAARSERRLTDRQVQLFDTLFSDAERRDRAGEFDPRLAGEAVRGRLQGAQRSVMSSVAGGLKTLGYKPGDTPALDTVRQTSQQGQLAIADAVKGVEDQARAAKTSAYRAADPSILNPGIQSAQRQQQIALSQQQSLAPIIASAMPYLQQRTATLATTTMDPFKLKKIGAGVLGSLRFAA